MNSEPSMSNRKNSPDRKDEDHLSRIPVRHWDPYLSPASLNNSEKLLARESPNDLHILNGENAADIGIASTRVSVSSQNKFKKVHDKESSDNETCNVLGVYPLPEVNLRESIEESMRTLILIQDKPVCINKTNDGNTLTASRDVFGVPCIDSRKSHSISLWLKKQERECTSNPLPPSSDNLDTCCLDQMCAHHDQETLTPKTSRKRSDTPTRSDSLSQWECDTRAGGQRVTRWASRSDWAHGMPFGVDEILSAPSRREYGCIMIFMGILPTISLSIFLGFVALMRIYVTTCGIHCMCSWEKSVMYWLTVGIASRVSPYLFLSAFTVSCMLGAAAKPHCILRLPEVWILFSIMLLLSTGYRIITTMYINTFCTDLCGLLETVCIAVPMIALSLYKRQFRHIIPALAITLTQVYYVVILLQPMGGWSPQDVRGGTAITMAVLEIVYVFIFRRLFHFCDLWSSHLMALTAYNLVIAPHAIKIFFLFNISATEQTLDYVLNAVIFILTELVMRSNSDVALFNALTNLLLKRCLRNPLYGKRFELWSVVYAGVRPFSLCLQVVAFGVQASIPYWVEPLHVLGVGNEKCSGPLLWSRKLKWYNILLTCAVLLLSEGIYYAIARWQAWPRRLHPIRNRLWALITCTSILITALSYFVQTPFVRLLSTK